MQGGLQTRELSRVFRQLSVPVPLAPDTATAGPQAISACQSRPPLGEGIAKWRERPFKGWINQKTRANLQAGMKNFRNC